MAVSREDHRFRPYCKLGFPLLSAQRRRRRRRRGRRVALGLFGMRPFYSPSPSTFFPPSCSCSSLAQSRGERRMESVEFSRNFPDSQFKSALPNSQYFIFSPLFLGEEWRSEEAAEGRGRRNRPSFLTRNGLRCRLLRLSPPPTIDRRAAPRRPRRREENHIRMFPFEGKRLNFDLLHLPKVRYCSPGNGRDRLLHSLKFPWLISEYTPLWSRGEVLSRLTE